MYVLLKNIYLENVSKESLDNILLDLSNNNFISDYYYILHDKDVSKETGLLKKEHYHIIINYLNNDSHINCVTACKKNPIIKKLYDVAKSNINNCIEKCKNIKNSVRYLIHLDNKEKFQYNINEVVTNNLEYLEECQEIKIKSSDIDIILSNLLSGSKKEYTYKELCKYFLDSGKISYFVQYYDRIICILKIYDFNVK